MTLAVDNRSKLGAQPSMHALIVGVSHYSHLPNGGGRAAPDDLGLPQLTTAANSGMMVYEWLRDRYANPWVPLSTVRMLLAPSERELEAVPQLASLTNRPSCDNFLEAAADWRDDAATNPENVTFLYLAGHSFD